MRATLADLNTCDRAGFVAALGHLFEGSPWVAEGGFDARPFKSAAHLHAELCGAMRDAPAERQLALILAHPDLGGRLARQGALTPESAREQASAGLDRMPEEQRAELERLNAAYRARFGFPFVLCARLNNLDAILGALRARLNHTPREEHAAALAEIEKIAWLRLQDTLAQGTPEE